MRDEKQAKRWENLQAHMVTYFRTGMVVSVGSGKKGIDISGVKGR